MISMTWCWRPLLVPAPGSYHISNLSRVTNQSEGEKHPNDSNAQKLDSFLQLGNCNLTCSAPRSCSAFLFHIPEVTFDQSGIRMYKVRWLDMDSPWAPKLLTGYLAEGIQRTLPWYPQNPNFLANDYQLCELQALSADSAKQNSN